MIKGFNLAGKIVLFTGGSRSGKSMLAQRLTESWPGRLLYVATAEARDHEMERRIEAHRRDRGERWDTLEEPLDLAGAVERAGSYGGVMIDCLTLWTSNLMESCGDNPAELHSRLDNFIESLGKRKVNLAVVTNEVGMGIVPGNALSREFRDISGLVNQRVSEVADEAYLVVSGRLLNMKSPEF